MKIRLVGTIFEHAEAVKLNMEWTTPERHDGTARELRKIRLGDVRVKQLASSSPQLDLICSHAFDLIYDFICFMLIILACLVIVDHSLSV